MMKLRVIQIDPHRVEVDWVWGDWRKGTTRQWAKKVKGVGEGDSGVAIDGDWLSPGNIVEVPAVVVVVRSEGSHRHPHSEFYIYHITESKSGDLEPSHSCSYDTKGERARAINALRDFLNEVVATGSDTRLEVLKKLSLCPRTVQVVADVLQIPFDDLLQKIEEKFGI